MKTLANISTHFPWALKNTAALVAIAAALTAVFSMTSADADRTRANGHGHRWNIEGSWLTTVTEITPEGESSFQTLVSYSPAGAFIMTPAFPSGQSDFQGTWKRTGRHTFVWTAYSFGFGPDPEFEGEGDPPQIHEVTIRVQEEVTLAPDGSSYTGTGQVDLLAVDGTFLFELGESTVQADRIHAE